MRLQPIRTAAEIVAHIKIQPVQQVPLYQKLTKKATKLRLLGMSYISRKDSYAYEEIANSLNIGKGTVASTCKYKGR